MGRCLGDFHHGDPIDGRRVNAARAQGLETGKGSYGGTEAREGERCCVRRDHLVLRGRSLDGALGLGTGDIIAVEGVMVGLAIAHPPRRREGLADYPVRVVPGGCVAARAEADVEAVLRPFDEAPSQRRR